ncbi:DMT family transporter [Inquilinus sp. Marseille-Q2685]|uniref:DMT family transporter n=1 Tax=Inquilinus sp. Marseille-Q2685 TaxID=2866581 RepID=UPI001CE3C8D7|nr:DMT family transporter [Inquilinus sp. Marseille-Q2685]
MDAVSIPAPGRSALVRWGFPALFVVLWASAFTAAKVAVTYAPPFLLLSTRFLLAGLVLAAIARLSGRRWSFGPGAVARFALLGIVTMAVYLTLSYFGMQTVTSGFAALIISMNPVLTAVLAPPLLGERLTRTRLAGLALGVLGVAIVLQSRLGGGIEGPVGIAFTFGALVALSAGTILYKRIAPSGDLWYGTAVQTLAAGVVLLPLGLALEPVSAIRWTPELLAGFLWLALAVSLCSYLLWFDMLDRLGASTASALHFLVPPIGLLLGWAVLGEHVPPLDLLGVVPIALGIRLVTRATPATARNRRAAG